MCSRPSQLSLSHNHTVNLEAYLQNERSVLHSQTDRDGTKAIFLTIVEVKMERYRAPLLMLRKAQVSLHPW